MTWHHRWLLIYLSLTISVVSVQASFPAWLSIYLEGTHAGSFYYLASSLDLDQQYTLLLFDAHSDANAVFHSDAIRTALRAADIDQSALFREWRQAGKIQAYNWIEPLMPRPLAEVDWILPRNLDAAAVFHLQNQARLALDAHEEVCPRDEPEVSRAFFATDLDRVRADKARLDSGERPIVVSLDLDYFAGFATAELAARVDEVFEFIVSLRHCVALTISVSPSYLQDSAQLDLLIRLTVQRCLRIANAHFQFEPFAQTGPDTSARANALRTEGRPVPQFDLANLSPTTKSLLAAGSDRLRVIENPVAWREFLDSVQPRQPEIRVCGRPSRTLTVGANQLNDLSLELVGPGAPTNVCWYAVRAERNAYNCADDNQGFAAGAPRWIYEDGVLVCNQRMLGAATLRSLADPKSGYGKIRLFATMETADGTLTAAPVEVTIVDDQDGPLQRALSEEFSLPYLFFGARLSTPAANGPELGLGADCANFAVYGLRRLGWLVPWCDARQLAKRLRSLTSISFEENRTDPQHLLKIDPADAAAGIFFIFRNHVAVLWHSHTAGWVSLDDLVGHQLEGSPEICPLGELVKARPQFEILTVPSERETTTVLVGGDLSVNGPLRTRQLHNLNQFAVQMHSADLGVANLECSVPGTKGDHESKPYCFRGPDNLPDLLRKAGFRAFLVANNHTGDFGLPGFNATLNALKRAQVETIGGGTNLLLASHPTELTVKGARFALFGCADPSFCKPIATETSPGMCPWDSALLPLAIADAKAQGETCLVLCHWDPDGNLEACRERAIEWIDAGADIVIGSGPHSVETREIQHGKPVFYSLGDLEFNGNPLAHLLPPTWLRLEVLQNGRLVRAQLLQNK